MTKVLTLSRISSITIGIDRVGRLTAAIAKSVPTTITSMFTRTSSAATASDRPMTESVATPTKSTLLELDFLVRRAKEVPPDQPQRWFGHSRAVSAQDGDIPDRHEHRPFVYELLDLVQHRLSPLSIALGGLLLNEPLNVGIASVGVQASGSHE